MELKPCPFCGGKAEIKDYELGPNLDGSWNQCIIVRCAKYYSCGGTPTGIKDKNKVILMWNNRTPDTIVPLETLKVTYSDKLSKLIPHSFSYNTMDTLIDLLSDDGFIRSTRATEPEDTHEPVES